MRDYTYQITPKYSKDKEFGTHYGGNIKIPDRFQFGIDEFILDDMWKRKELLFNQCRDYILTKLKNDYNIPLPTSIAISCPNLKDFDIYSLFSVYKGDNLDSSLTIKQKVKEGMVGSLLTMEGYFSLQTAVNYCSFLMWCAYAENTFTLVIPTVGSEMRIATITRDNGFELIRKWQIQSPGPPFK